MIDWAHPPWLLALGLVPVVALLGAWAWRRRRQALEIFAAIEVLRQLVPMEVLRIRAWQVALGALAIAGMALAAAGPRLGFEWETRRAKGVAIAVVLDVSRSMDAMDDGSTSRLTVARRKVSDFVGLCRGDVVALVLFANGAFPRIPLTADYGTLLWALEDTSTETLRAQGTTLADALVSATRLLDRAGSAGKAILLVSDGEGHDDEARLEGALAKVREAEVRIFALGVGEEKGAPIPLAEGGFKKDRDGNVVLSKLDPARLTRLASATGGAYVQAGPSVSDVKQLYESEIREKLQAAERDARRDKVWNERFQWPLAGALLMMALSAAIGVARKPTLAALLLALLLLPARAEASSRDDGLAAAARKEWSEAIRLLGQARVEDPADVGVGHALGEALYRAGRYREAEQVFRSLSQADREHLARHLYNAGNSAYRDGRLDDAAEYLRQAVQADPEFAAAQQNATAVEKEIAARRQQKPPEQEPSSGESEPQPQSDAGAEGQQGQPQDQQGEPQQGEQQGEGEPSAPGQPQAGEQGEERGEPGQRQPESGGEGEPAEGEGSASGEPELDQTGDEAAQVVEEEGGGGMSKEEAARLVESVPDGQARTVQGGEEAEKDW